jgi:hypothetical protein
MIHAYLPAREAKTDEHFRPSNRLWGDGNGRSGRINRQRRLLVALTCVLVQACSAGEPSVCKQLPGTQEELARTPRDDANLELLALSLSDGVTADEAVYRRLVRDIAAIRAVDSRMGGIEYSPAETGELLVAPATATRLLVKSGLYTEWDCLNRHFRAKQSAVSGRDYVVLEFKGRYNLNRVGRLYDGLDGVRYAEPNFYIHLDKPASIYVTPGRDAWHYVLGGAHECSGDRVSCGFYYFVVSSSGAAKLVQEWHVPRDNTPDQEPSWLKQYARGTAYDEKRSHESDYRNDYPRYLGQQNASSATTALVRFKNAQDLARYIKHHEKAGDGVLPATRPTTVDAAEPFAKALLDGTEGKWKAMAPADENSRVGAYISLPEGNNPRVEVFQRFWADWRVYSIEYLASAAERR